MPKYDSLSRVFGIDTRALAAFRIGIGSLVLVDIGLRLRDLEAHYTDAGILPRDVLWKQTAGSWRWSLHTLDGSATFQLILFAIAAAFAIAYLVGYRTRLAAVTSWVLLASLHSRNPFVVNGGDVLLRLLLFWSIFLPLDVHWSVRGRQRASKSPRLVVSLASAAILLQVGLLYWMAGYFKLRGSWLAADTLERVFRSDAYAKPGAYLLADFSNLLACLGSVAVASEVVLPILIFSPVWTRQLRLFAIVWFGLFHLGIELTLTVGLFSYTSWIAWILFIPDSIWNRITRVPITDPNARDELPVPRRRRRSIIVNGVVGAALALVVWLNLATLREPWLKWLRWSELPKIGDATVLRQRWNLFPSPLQRDGWYIAVARLADGRTVDLFRDGKPADWNSYTKPKYVSDQFPNHRWRKYYRRLVLPTRTNLRVPLSWYLVRSWNDAHGPSEQIESFELHYMQEIGDDTDQEERYQQRFFSELDVEQD